MKIIIAPACNVPKPGTNPEPNQLILDRAIELATESASNEPVVIFTDGYTRQPERLPDGVAFVRGGPAVAISQVMFLRQLRQYLQSLESDYTLIAVMTPHYRRRFRRDVPQVLGIDIPIDNQLLKTPIRSFFSSKGADARSRSFAVWAARELAIEIISRISWKLYAKLTC